MRHLDYRREDLNGHLPAVASCGSNLPGFSEAPKRRSEEIETPPSVPVALGWEGVWEGQSPSRAYLVQNTLITDLSE